MAKKLDLENERKYLLSLIQQGGGNAEWAKHQAGEYAKQYPGFSLDKPYQEPGAATGPTGPTPGEAKIRDTINQYGSSKYGIHNSDIGWTGKDVTLGGEYLITPTRVDDTGRSWAGESDIKAAIDKYAANKGLDSLGTPKQEAIKSTSGTGNREVAYSKPEPPKPEPFVSPYSDKIEALLNKLIDRPAFSYNPETDPAYDAYKEQYAREGDRASRDVLGNLAGMTGGRVNTWATSAAAQERNRFAQAVTDRIPELQAQAYARYQADVGKDLSSLSALAALEQRARQQYESDRDYGRRDYEFEQNIYGRDRDYNRGIMDTARAFNYQVERDGKMFDYQVTRDKILDERWMKQFDYNEAQDILANALRERQITVAERNATLAQNKFEWEKDPTNPENMADPETIGALYASMFASENPEEWLKENAQYLSKDELKTLAGFLPSNSEAVQMMKVMFPDGIWGAGLRAGRG
jgi:hypothetical protein